MAFHDVRLPEDIERGAMGGPGFKTTVLPLSGGHEKRNIDWQTTRAKYDVGYGIESKEDYSDVLEFFYCRQGRAHSFRFKDWSDYQLGTSGNPVTIHTGDGSTTTYQIRKPYVSGATTFYRNLEKIVNGTLEVYVNGVLQTITTHYTVDLLTGILTFVTPPGNGLSVGVACEFDVPVRFDVDQLEISIETFDAGSIPNIMIIEVKGE